MDDMQEIKAKMSFFITLLKKKITSYTTLIYLNYSSSTILYIYVDLYLCTCTCFSYIPCFNY